MLLEKPLRFRRGFSVLRESMLMEYVIDSKKFYLKIADLEPEERGPYILQVAMDMHSGIADEKYMLVRPTKKSRKKGEVYNRAYTEEFESFWKVYPKKASKGTAFEIWEKLKMDKEELAEMCIKALIWQKAADGWTRDHGDYIPKAENYLKGRCWEDENPNKNKPEGYYDIDGVWRQG
jgi:hypothetical protein